MDHITPLKEFRLWHRRAREASASLEGFSYVWSAGNEGMDRKMETTIGLRA